MKIALVTGAGSGIGRGTALALLQEGYAVVLAGRRAEQLQETTAAAGLAGSLLGEAGCEVVVGGVTFPRSASAFSSSPNTRRPCALD